MATKGSKNKKIEQFEAQQILNTAKDLKLNDVVEELGALQISVQNNLATLTATLTSKIQQLSDVQTAIELKEQRLKDLHGIENEAIRLDDIKAQIAEAEAVAQEKQKVNLKQWDDMVAERNKNWQRDEEEHKYSIDQMRKKAADEYNAMLEKNKRDEAIRQDALNRTWSDREKALQAQEADVANLKKQVADFDVTVKAKVEQAQAIVSASLKQKYEHEIAMMKKDFDAQKTLGDTKISAMSDSMSKLEAQIDELNKQLAAARQDAKEIATSALQSASGRQVADALQKVVDAKSDSNAKK